MENSGEILIYQSEDGDTSLEVKLNHETVWLNQKQMAELFDKDSDTVDYTFGIYIKRANWKPKQLPRNPR